jgi:hypothetical protein
VTAVLPLIPDASGPGFVAISAREFRAIVGEESLADWATFAESWNHLETDRHMADGGRFRRRRFASFKALPGSLTREPHGPHFQSRDYNPLNGGVDRWFEPVTGAIAAHPVSRRLVTLCLDVFTRARGENRSAEPWRVEMHQFRIEPSNGAPGKPTPEGMHRDGVEWVFVALVARTNVAGGVTNVGDALGRPLGAFTLIEPLDAVFLDDTRVRHGVTPIEVEDPARAAHRDALVLTFRSG